jgi:hypothetical protein
VHQALQAVGAQNLQVVPAAAQGGPQLGHVTLGHLANGLPAVITRAVTQAEVYGAQLQGACCTSLPFCHLQPATKVKRDQCAHRVAAGCQGRC